MPKRKIEWEPWKQISDTAFVRFAKGNKKKCQRLDALGLGQADEEGGRLYRVLPEDYGP